MTDTERETIENAELRRRLAEVEAALERAEAALRCLDQLAILMANQGGAWPEHIER